MDSKEYYEKNKERIRARARAYYHAHSDECKARAKEYKKRVGYGKIYYDRNREKIREVVRNESQALKRETFSAYGNTCKFCGETTFEYLQIDHINGNPEKTSTGKRIAGPRLYRKLRSLGWPKKGYRLLCSNCNQCRQYYGDKTARRLGLIKKRLLGNSESLRSDHISVKR